MDIVEKGRQNVEVLRALLGPVFRGVTGLDRRRKGAVGRGERHRLALMVDEWERAVADGAHNPVATIELDIAATVFSRWSQSPIWDELLPAMVDPDYYPHALVCLTAAMQLGGVPQPSSAARAPDLIVNPGMPNAFKIEVKCPRRLTHPAPALDGDSARKIVRAAFKNAGTNTEGQLGGGGILLLGAFHTGQADVDALLVGAKRELGAVRRPHIIGVMFQRMWCYVDQVEMHAGTMRAPVGAAVQGITSLHWVANDSYSGPIRLEIGSGPVDTAGLREIEDPDGTGGW